MSRKPAGSGVESKRPYHHGALREALIAAAVEMLEEGGEAAVNMREAARRAGVSSGAPFRHFESKEALLAAVAEDAARRLAATMQDAAQAAADDPLHSFRAMGVAYVVWAAEQPALFSLLHAPQHRYFERFGISMLQQKQRTKIETLLAAARAREEANAAPEMITLTSHALVYGLSRMLIDGLLSPHTIDGDDARELALAVTSVLGRGLRGPPERTGE